METPPAGAHRCRCIGVGAEEVPGLGPSLIIVHQLVDLEWTATQILPLREEESSTKALEDLLEAAGVLRSYPVGGGAFKALVGREYTLVITTREDGSFDVEPRPYILDS